MKREELFKHVKETLVKEFECDESAIVPEARFYEDLDLDSIDAVDLIVRLRNERNIDVSWRSKVSVHVCRCCAGCPELPRP